MSPSPLFSRPKALIAGVAILALASLGLGLWVFLAKSSPVPSSSTEAEQAGQSRASLSVTLVSPTAIEWPDVMTASGSITPWQEAIVGAQVDGLRLVEVLADVGDTVRQGQLLAHFDDETTVADINQQKAAVAEAQATLTEAEGNARRVQGLRNTGAMSEQDIAQYVTASQTARARLESAQAMLKSKEVRLKQTRVLAPDDGVISSRSATLGSVAGNGTELFRLVRKSRLEWRGELVAAQIPLVQAGVNVRLSLPDGSAASGTVRQIAPTLDTTSRIGLIYVDIDPLVDGQPSQARAGMFATGTLTLGQRQGLAVPETAVVSRDGRNYIFVLGDNAHVRQVKVTVGRRRDGLVEIKPESGAEIPPHIIGVGAGFLNDGDTVRVVTDITASQGKGTP